MRSRKVKLYFPMTFESDVCENKDCRHEFITLSVHRSKDEYSGEVSVDYMLQCMSICPYCHTKQKRRDMKK